MEKKAGKREFVSKFKVLPMKLLGACYDLEHLISDMLYLIFQDIYGMDQAQAEGSYTRLLRMAYTFAQPSFA